MAPSQGERIARLEAKVDRIEEDIESLVLSLDRLTKEIHSLVSVLDHTKGVVKAVVGITSLIWTIGVVAWQVFTG